MDKRANERENKAILFYGDTSVLESKMANAGFAISSGSIENRPASIEETENTGDSTSEDPVSG